MRPNTTSTLKDFIIKEPFELWQLTMSLRISKDGKLQQKEISNLGGRRWVDVPFEITDKK